jgi:DNA-binding NarL/FixJ family response regulator
MSELINKGHSLVVVGSEETASEACTAIEEAKPDLVILDISLADGSGIDLIPDIRSRFGNLPILILSMYDEALYAERAVMAGANGYIMKQEATEQIVKAIHCVLNGEIYVSKKVKEKVFRRMLLKQEHKTKTSPDILTDRELEVFRLIGKGFSTKEIAQRLNLSIKTIGTYREKIKKKLDLKHYTALVEYAVHWTITN